MEGPYVGSPFHSFTVLALAILIDVATRLPRKHIPTGTLEYIGHLMRIVNLVPRRVFFASRQPVAIRVGENKRLGNLCKVIQV